MGRNPDRFAGRGSSLRNFLVTVSVILGAEVSSAQAFPGEVLRPTATPYTAKSVASNQGSRKSPAIITPIGAQKAPYATDALQKQFPGSDVLNSAHPDKNADQDARPNVVLILLDDIGFSASGTFGGPIPTPSMSKLADNGISYNNFNNAAMCAATRAALLSGRNHHKVGFGTSGDYSIPHHPGNHGVWPKSSAAIAKVLQTSGYSTSAFGKWHNTPPWEISPAGPFDRWPTGLGFDYFYGFMMGEGSQWEPDLYQNTSPVLAPISAKDGYNLTGDLVDKALGWVRSHNTFAEHKPYFVYFAPGATHKPHQVSRKWIDPFKGRFDQGWDQVRDETYRRQIRMGVIPRSTRDTARPDSIPSWNSLSPQQKVLTAREMEVFAGFLAQTDYEIGRLIEGIRAEPGGENTIIMYIIGDNGASLAGGSDGVEVGVIDKSPTERLRDNLARLGGPELNNDYAAGWGWATNAPFQWGKIIASHFGGTRNPLILSWPARFRGDGRIRSQFTHVVDIAPTVYDLIGIRPPDVVDGVKQKPLDGQSFAATIASADAPLAVRDQYFEMMGNLGLYYDGWMASYKNVAHGKTNHPWELYNLKVDFSQSVDVADKYPKVLDAMVKRFYARAVENGVLPVQNGPALYNKDRPSLVEGKTHFVYQSEMDHIPAASAPDFAKSHTIAVDVMRCSSACNGVLVEYGTRINGFSLYMDHGKIKYVNRYAGQGEDILSADTVLGSGPSVVKYEFTKLAERKTRQGFMDASGVGRLVVNDREVARGEIRHIQPVQPYDYLYYGGLTVGRSWNSPVSDDYVGPARFSGEMGSVIVDIRE